MRRPIVVAALLLLLGASTATAQGGLALYWDGCSDGGVSAKTFACDTNSGPGFELYASVVLPQDMQRFAAASVAIQCWLLGPVPDWWKTRTGDCRLNAISSSFDSANLVTNCPDIWQGTLHLSVFDARPDVYASNLLRLTGGAAVPAGSEFSLVADGIELVICKSTNSRETSFGTGSCAGCATGATLVFGESKLQQPAGVGDYTVINEAPGRTRSVDWQGGAPTPTQNRTWGAVKGLYR